MNSNGSSLFLQNVENSFESIIANIKDSSDVPNILLQKYESAILKPLNYLREKRYFTTNLTLNNLNYWLNVPTEKLNLIVEIMELVIDSTYM